MKYFTRIFLTCCALGLMACANMPSWLGGPTDGQEGGGLLSSSPQLTKYSDSPQSVVPSNRQYKRMTRAKMEEESDLGANAGSMWQMEGQSSYLFAQNNSRREGDMLNVKLEGPALKQVETKVGVIKNLIKQLEDQLAAEQAAKLAAENGGDPNRAPAAVAEKKTEKKDDGKDDLKDIQTVQTRIVEKLPDGNYRLKGAQPFMIGKREYKLIVAGMIRAEDYNDTGVSSNKLLDPQFDVVSIRRNQKNDQNNLL